MSRKYEVTAITGKYTDRDGQERSRYMTIGAVIEGRHGLQLKLEAVPIGWDGWAYLNEPKPKDGAETKSHAGGSAPRNSAPRTAPAPSGFDDDGEDIPY